MSQAKVDKYKEYKANKAQIMKKQRMVKKIEITAAVLVAVVFLGWIGYSIYAESTDPTNNASVVEMDTTALEDYIASVAE